MTFEQWLAAEGYKADEVNKPENAKQRKHLELAWKAETQPAPKPEPEAKPKVESSFDDKMAAIEAESARVQAIQDATAVVAAQHVGNPDKVKQLRELCAAAVADQKVTLKDFQLNLLRLDRMVGPIVMTPRSQPLNDDVIEAAVCKMGKLGSLEKSFSEQTLETADKHFRNGVSLHRLIGICARQNGWRGDDVKGDLRNAMRAAFGWGQFQASSIGPSTLSVSGILSNTANKFLRDSWNAVESTWRMVTAVRSVNDFKQITSYSLTGDLSYEKVAPGGELKHGTLGNETYTNQADTYGKILGIDRRDLINDDLGAFTAVSKRLGRGGALKLNEVFWIEFLADHSTFFPTDASLLNYDAGTDTAFGADGLTAADVFWKAKTDPDGKPLGLMAKILLVPPAHRIPALRLMSSQSTTKDTDLGINNPHAGMYQVACSVYLANSAMGGGYSSLAWYMLADPNELPVIETAFLNGVETPTVEEVEMSADHLGMAWRAYHDFGVNKQEYRAALKLKGEA